MARTIELEFVDGESSPTVDLFPEGSQTLTETIALTEDGTKTGYYTGTIATATQGNYDCVCKDSSGVPLAYRKRYIDDTDALTYSLTPTEAYQYFLLAVLTGAISDAGTSTETFAVTIEGRTFTTTNGGLDANGNRTAPGFTMT